MSNTPIAGKVTPEILALMKELRASGMSQDAVSKQLGLSRNTIRYHTEPGKKESELERATARGIRAKYEAFRLLGSKCIQCGDTRLEILCINHINGDGAEDEFSGIGQLIYRAICAGKRTTDGLNLLCPNCNVLHEYALGRRTGESRPGKLHTTVIKMLGGVCVKCGCTDLRVLEVNHIDGGGKTEYLSKSNQAFYWKVFYGERTIDDLNVMCASCNALYEYERKAGLVQ